MPRFITLTCCTLFYLFALASSAARAQDEDQPPLPATGGTTGALPPAPASAEPEKEESAVLGQGQDEATAATQVASFAVTPLKDSPAVVTVISGEDIRNAGARDLIDVLNLVPGYFMGLDTVGVVGPGFRGIWGYEGKILLIIDGKEMNELSFSTMQLGNEFPIELIERVEIVRGPGSVIYGGSAELSVINVVTRGLQGSTDVSATATYGQLPSANNFGTGFGRRKFTLSGRYVVDAVPGLSTFFALSAGEGQRSVRNFVDNAGAVANMEGRSALNPGVIQLGVGYKDVQASFMYHRLGMTTVSGIGAVLPAAERATFEAYHGELVGTFRPNSRVEIVPRFNLTYQTPWRTRPESDALFYDKSVRRLRGRLLGRWAVIDQLQITAGTDAIFDEARLLSPPGPGLQLPFGDANQVDYRTLAGFIEMFSENPIVNVAVGARYDHQSSVGGALVPRLVLLKSFGPLSLKGLFSRSFRAPGIENLNLGVNVRPERTRAIEFEAALDVTAQHRLSANVFDLAINSPIAYTVDPTTMEESYLNLGRQGTRGFEVTYRFRHRLARLEANYSFYVPSVANNTPSYNVPGHSSQFLAAAAHRGSIRANLRPWEHFGITPSAVILGPHFARGAPDAAGAPSATEIPTQVLANLFIYKDNVAVRGLRVGLGIYNLLGTKYRFVRPYATAPRDASPEAAQEAYLFDHAPLPGLDREVMLQLSYLLEPS